MNENLQNAIRSWTDILGDKQVFTDPYIPEKFRKDTNGIERRIPALLRVLDAASLPGLMQISHQHAVPVYPVSTGLNWGYGSAMPCIDDCVLIDLSGLVKIIDFDADLGVVSVEPGVTQAMLADFLDAQGAGFLVPVTGSGPHCSLMGNALERGYGVTPCTDHFAAVTDIEAVLPDGRLFRSAMNEAGSPELARLFKWGIGPYLNGLFTQSGFGIVTRISIALARQPESVKVCIFSLKEDGLLEGTVERLRDLLSRFPGTVAAVNLMNRHRMLAMTAPYPFEQIGPDGLIPPALVERLGKQYLIAPWTGLMTLYGTSASVRVAQSAIRTALRGIASRLVFLTHGQADGLANLAQMIPGTSGKRIAQTSKTLALSLDLVNGRPNETALPLAYWRNRKAPTPGAMNPAQDDCGLIWYSPLIAMKPTQVRAYVDMVQRIACSFGIEPLMTLTSLNDRIFDSTVPLLYDKTSPVAMQKAKACFDQLLDTGRELGFFPYRLGPDTMLEFPRRHPRSADLAARLKQALDPQDLLAPGRYR